MSEGEFQTATWSCDRCPETISQRFHVPTDGDPKNAEPPPPWRVVVDGRAEKVEVLCPSCSAAYEREEQAGQLMTYGGMTDEVAAHVWEANHICLRCEHLRLCKHAPDEDSADLLVTVCACLAFEPAEAVEDDEDET